MLFTALLILPCFMCMIGVLVLLSIKNRQKQQTYLLWTLIVGAIELAISAHNINAAASPKVLVYLDMLGHYAVPVLFPLIILYQRELSGRPLRTVSVVVMFLPAAILGTASLMSYLNIGLDNAATFLVEYDRLGSIPPQFNTPQFRAHVYLTFLTHNSITIIYAAFTLGVIAAMLAKNKFHLSELLRLAKGKTINRFNLIALFLITIIGLYAIRLIVGRQIILQHQWIAAVFSIITATLIFGFVYVSVLFNSTRIDMHSMRKPAEFKNRDSVGALTPIEDTSASKKEGMSSAQAERFEKFKKYMEEQRPYLDSSISIESVAEALSSNRTYISSIVKDNYHTSFRSYVNALRIEEVKKMLLNSPDEKLESIAAACGFSSSSQMIKKFCELTGDPPRVWMKKHASDL